MNTETYFTGFLLILSIALIILGGVIRGSADKLTDSTQKKDIQRSSMIIIFMGIIFLLVSGAALYTSFTKGGTSGAPSSTFYYY